MFCRIFFLLIRIPLFSAVSSAAVALAASGQQALYPIDSSDRGTQIYNTFTALSPATGIQVPEVALQTTLPATTAYQTYRYITNGIVPYVQAITQTPFNTLLIVSYFPTQTPATLQYIVLPPEQVTAVLYFPTISNLPLSNAAFTATVVPGTLPFFTVDPLLRTTDIASAVTQLMSAPFVGPVSQVWVQTTLTGPFNPSVPNGLLKNITAVSITSGLIQFTFLPPNQPIPLTVIISPEQVQQITYVLNFNSP
jgi:hypothetical protein